MQVILKPEPGNPQELHLGSLRALGIDTAANDVRFVEDNWESPVLGAWGLGWEVWLNGMEIAQVQSVWRLRPQIPKCCCQWHRSLSACWRRAALSCQLMGGNRMCAVRAWHKYTPCVIHAMEV